MKNTVITGTEINAIRITAGATRPLPITPEGRMLNNIIFGPKYRLELAIVRELFTDEAIREALTEKAAIDMEIEDVVLTGGSFEDRLLICGDTYEYELREELTEVVYPDFDKMYEFEDGTILLVTDEEAFRVTPALKEEIIREYGITPVTV